MYTAHIWLFFKAFPSNSFLFIFLLKHLLYFKDCLEWTNADRCIYMILMKATGQNALVKQ